MGNSNVVFVLGAGASYADGAPLQAEILPIIMSDELQDIPVSPVGRTVREFIADNFAWNAGARIYPTLETVFGFLDYFISQDEHLSAKYTNRKIRYIKEGLIKLIHYVISAKSNKQGQTYRSFWEAVRKYNRNIAVLTLNYDTLLEEAFGSVRPNLGYINYCIHLMNYDLPGNGSAPNWWAFPEKSAAPAKGDSPTPVKIMKGHGSLNWKYCNCCNQILLTPWDTKIDLFSDGFDKPDADAGKHRCPIDASEFETLIIPPSHIKKISHPVISQILNEALREIRACRKIVFVGYSFPDADVHFKALFKKSLTAGQEIIVVNNSKKEQLKYNYRALTPNIRFVNLSFADFLKNNSLLEEILSEFKQLSTIQLSTPGTIRQSPVNTGARSNRFSRAHQRKSASRPRRSSFCPCRPARRPASGSRL
ncbi:SIR2-like domain-containing protein [Desulfoscipio geothermicus DSM 3669]|uniref:SIR2-like domain-containing protein n=1 Tax=Desulfoscipio geothermicus DSM 3669 TaxID=1121426 RepID=A0A1I6CUC9_9FIRM|nr:SIR2-like domain-containing protein [Desulfoscipio geothermicus DSM 3669]